MIQKRKTCPGCKVPYRSGLAWATCRDEFFERNQKAEEKRQEKLKKLETETKCSFRMTERIIYDSESKSQKHIYIPEKKWSDVEHEFINRMKEDAVHRKQNYEKLSKTQSLIENCTFTPQLSARSREFQFEPFEQRTQADIEARQLRQQEFELSFESKYTDDTAQTVKW